MHLRTAMTISIGYALSSEEHPPADLVRHAALAEQHGFEFALISDHYHPWVDAQGHAPFVWSVLGAIAQATDRLEVGTGVTCPTMRIHPGVVAQAAATTAAMFGDRFFLGVGTGENLNEHILGDHWPAYEERREMLIEAVEVMRGLWKGDQFNHQGDHYVVENARIYTLPAAPPPIMIAAAGPESAAMAGKWGEGLIVTAPDPEVIDAFRRGGGAGKPVYGQMTGCWASSAVAAKETVHRIWPNAGVPGELSQELPLPRHFEQASSLVTPDMLAEKMPVGPDAAGWIASAQEYANAGVDHLYLHQVGPDQEGFFAFFDRELREPLTNLAALG